MKNLLVIAIALLISQTSFADLGVLETMQVDAERVNISIADNDKSLVLNFNDEIEGKVHTSIDIQRINDLEYKTRVMRYFGGMLVNNTFHFKNLVVVVEGRRLVYSWSRDNVSAIVNKLCHQAAAM
jgi:hypothetical protein